MSKAAAYKRAGVDIAAGSEFIRRIKPLVRSTYGPQVLGDIGGFAGLYRLNGDVGLFRRRYKDPVLVACADGVGTKLRIAQALDKHDTIGIDLVAMNVNDLVAQGAEPLFFCDYLVTGKLKPSMGAAIVQGIAAGCREAGCALLGGETAEHPGEFPHGAYDLAGFAVGVVERRKIVDGSRIEPGDAVVGLFSSGLHANGFSLARKVLLEDAGLSLRRRVTKLGGKLGDELLKPTRIYAGAIRHLIKHYQVKKIIKGLAHITGGGLIENVPRILPAGLAVRIRRDARAWEIPPIFALIEKLGQIDRAEMWRVFNMGIGMVLICPRFNANYICRTLRGRKVKVEAKVIGEVVEGDGTVEIEE